MKGSGPTGIQEKPSVDLRTAVVHLYNGRKKFHEGAFEDAEVLLRKVFLHRQLLKTHDDNLYNMGQLSFELAVISMQLGKIDDAASYLFFFIPDYAVAETDANKARILDGIHLASLIHFNQGRTDLAYEGCGRAVKGRKALYGVTRPYHESVSLMAVICESRDVVEADFWAGLLPTGFNSVDYRRLRVSLSLTTNELRRASKSSPKVPEVSMDDEAPPAYSEDRPNESNPQEPPKYAQSSSEPEIKPPRNFSRLLCDENQAAATISSVNAKQPQHSSQILLKTIRTILTPVELADATQIPLKANIDVESRAFDPCKTLLWASLSGHLSVAILMVSGGQDSSHPKLKFWGSLKARKSAWGAANVNCEDSEGFTALHRAAKAGHVAIVQLLIEHGAQVTARRKCTHGLNIARKWDCALSALDYAIVNNHTDVVACLLQKGAETHTSNRTAQMPLHYASRYGNVAIGKMLLAAPSGHQAIFAGDADGKTPLILALEHVCVAFTELLLANGADTLHVRQDLSTPLHAAVRSNDPKLTRLLLATDAVKLVSRPDDNGRTPLHLAAAARHDQLTPLLVTHATDVNARDVDGLTPLHAAASTGSPSTVTILLSHGADALILDNLGRSALHGAVQRGDEEIVQLLVGAGADVDCEACVEGVTPVELAARSGHSHLVRLLYQAGARWECEATSLCTRDESMRLSFLVE